LGVTKTNPHPKIEANAANAWQRRVPPCSHGPVGLLQFTLGGERGAIP